MRAMTIIDEMYKKYEILTIIKLIKDFEKTSQQAFINVCKQWENNPDADDELLYSWFWAEKEYLDRQLGEHNNE